MRKISDNSFSCASTVEVRRTCARVSTLMPTVRSLRIGGNLDTGLSAECGRAEFMESGYLL